MKWSRPMAGKSSGPCHRVTHLRVLVPALLTCLLVVNAEPAGGDRPKAAVEPWGKLSEDEQARAIEELKAFAEKAKAATKVDLTLRETGRFLFYSDLKANEARDCEVLLGKMYDRLSDLFAAGNGVNVWRGKALVFVFSDRNDYAQFEKLMHQANPAGTLGMCHTFANGDVHVAFFRQRDKNAFTRVLVHETSHGFLHRFKTPVAVPSWINEGLAEWIATELGPRGGNAAARAAVDAAAKVALDAHGGRIGPMLEAKAIEDWQYPVAESLTGYMIAQGRKNYASFVVGIKDGMSWQDALKEKYKAPRDHLVEKFGEQINVKDLKE